MLKRPCFRCGKPTRSNPCDDCKAKAPPRKSRPDTRPSRQARGYDAEYERNRKVMVAHARAYGLPCALCGKPFTARNVITAEHLVPKRSGGGNEAENLVPAHAWCNSGWRGRRRR